MSIRTRITLLLASLGLAFVAGLGILNLQSARQTEHLLGQRAKESLGLLNEIVELVGRPLATFAEDYSRWDDMAAFVESRDSRWGEINIESALKTYDASAAWVTDADCRVVYRVCAAGIEFQGLPLPPERLRQAFSGGPLAHFYVSTANGLLEVRGASIVPSEDYQRQSRPVGFFLAGRIWSPAALAEIGRLAGGDASLVSPATSSREIVLSPEESAGSIYRALPDDRELPVALLCFRQTYVILQAMRQASISLLLNLAIFFAAIVTGLYLILTRWVKRPMETVTSSLVSEDPAPLQAMARNGGEFGQLARRLTEFLHESARRREREESMLLLSTALEQSVEAVVITDASGVIRYVNPAFETITGYTREEAVGSRPSMVKSGRHDAEFYRNLWDTLTRGDVWNGRFINRRKNGALFEEEATISPVRDESGTIVSFVAVKRDVSAQTALEAELRRAQKLESIGQLAAGVAHEINTPAQYVGDNLRFLKDAFLEMVTAQRFILEATGSEDLLEDIPRALDHSLEGVSRIAEIVRAMKDFSHPSQEKSPTNLNHAIESTVMVARNEWKYVADVALDLDPDLPMVECVRGEVNQVILNLVVNAAHAIAEVVGDGSRGKGTITIRTRREGAFAEIEVADTGTGIDVAILDRIFDPFFTTKAVGKGTGQGLSIAHAVVARNHGGTLSVENRKPNGASFVIRLPIASPRNATSEMTTAAPAGAIGA